MTGYVDEIENVKEYYANLLIMQYRSKYKARETVKLGAEIYMGDGLVFDLQDVLDIDIAEGKQLDLIGKILDCPRIIPGFDIDKPFFTFEHTGDDYGFSIVSQPSQGYFKSLSYDYSSMYSLPDNDYRMLLKFKAIANRARASWKDIDDIFYSIFGDKISVTNNKNLSITYNILQSAVTDGLLAAIKLGYLEPPLGIDYSMNYYYWNRDAFTIVGTPTITEDGIASDFSSSNYVNVTLPQNLTSFEFYARVKTPSDIPLGSNTKMITSMKNTSNSGGFGYRRDTNKIGIWNGSNWLYGNLPEVELNTWYDLKAVYDGSTYTAFYKKSNDDKYIQIASVNNFIYSNEWALGYNYAVGSEYFQDGVIDLKYIKMYVNGIEVFNGGIIK